MICNSWGLVMSSNERGWTINFTFHDVQPGNGDVQRTNAPIYCYTLFLVKELQEVDSHCANNKTIDGEGVKIWRKERIEWPSETDETRKRRSELYFREKAFPIEFTKNLFNSNNWLFQLNEIWMARFARFEPHLEIPCSKCVRLCKTGRLLNCLHFKFQW